MTAGTRPDRPGGRRLLVTATGPANPGPDATGSEPMAELFTTDLGYQHLPMIDLGQPPDRIRDGLRTALAGLGPDDRIVVYLAGTARIASGDVLAVDRDETGDHGPGGSAGTEPGTAGTEPGTAGGDRPGLPVRQMINWLVAAAPATPLVVLLGLRCAGPEAVAAAHTDLARWTPGGAPAPIGPDHDAASGGGASEAGTAGTAGPAIVAVLVTRIEGPDPDAFATAFAAAARHPASGGRTQPELRIETVLRVATADRPTGAPWTATYLPLSGADEPAALLPNPRHRRVGPGEAGGAEAGGNDDRTDDGGGPALFTGRHRALVTLARWLTDNRSEEAHRPRVVTGEAGSGKSAVLGTLAALADPARRPAVPVDGLPDAVLAVTGRIDAALDASGRTTEEVFARIVAATRPTAGGRDGPGGSVRPLPGNVGDLLDQLPRRPDPPTLLIDGVDEAADPTDLVRSTLRRIFEHGAGRLRLLVAAGPRLAPLLGGGHIVIDLDAVPYTDPEGMREYTRRVLLAARPDGVFATAPAPVVTQTAAAMVHAAGTSYLVAGLLADGAANGSSLPNPANAEWRRALPHTVPDAVREDLSQRFGSRADEVRTLLLPLAYAEGAGLPWEDVWPRLVNALTPGAARSNAELRWLAETAGGYLVEESTGGRSRYRLRHRAVADCLRDGRNPEQDQRTITQALVDLVPPRPDGGADWFRAHPYVRTHLATHAAHGRCVDDLLADPLFLLAAARPRLLAALPAAESDEARAAAAVYLRAVPRLGGAPEAEHGAYLELAARCGQTPALADALAGSGVRRPWSARWAWWQPEAPPRTVTGHASGVLAVAVGDLGGRPVAVTGGDDHTVRIWDLGTGTAIGDPLTGHTAAVTAIALGHTGDTPIAVTGGDDHTVRIWDLGTGTAIGDPLTGHTAAVTAIALGHTGDTPIAVTGGDDRTVRVWDLATGRPIRAPLTGHTAAVTAIALGHLDDQPIALSASLDHSIGVWNLKSHRPVGTRITGHTGGVTSVAFGHLGGNPVAVSASHDRTIRTWNLNTRSPIGKSLAGHTDTVASVATGEIDGYPIAVSGGLDGTVRVWDLTTAAPLGRPLPGHTSGVTAVALGHLAGHPVAVSASHDHTLRIWDSAIDRPAGDPFTGHSDSVMSVAAGDLNGVPVAISGSADHTIRIWDLATGHPIGRPLTAHTGGVWTIALGDLNGRRVAVSGSADQRLRVWDPLSHRPVGEPLAGHTGWVWTVALGEIDDRTVAVSGSDDHSVRVWDLATGRPAGDPLIGHSGGVTSVAFGRLGDRPIAVSGSHDHTVRIWNLATGRPIGDPLTGHSGGVWAVALGNLDGQSVAISASADRTLRIWDLETGTSIGRPLAGHTDAVVSVTVGELDGHTVAVSGSDDHTVRIWDMGTHRTIGKPLAGHAGGVRSVAIGRLGGDQVIVSGGHDNTLRVWDLATGAPVEPVVSGHTNDVRSVAIGEVNGSPVIVSGSHDHTVRIWDLTTGEPIGGALAGHSGSVPAIAVGDINRRAVAVSGSDDHTLRVWDLASRRALNEPLAGHSAGVAAVALGQLGDRSIAVSGGDDHTVRVWDLSAGRPVGDPLTGHTGGVSAVALGTLGDGPIVVSGGQDRTVRVWDLATGRPIGDPFTGHTAEVTAVAFGLLDGHPIAISASQDRTVRTWEIDTGRKHRWRLRREKPPLDLPELRFAEPVRAMAFLPDAGELIVATGSAIEARTFRGAGRRVELDSPALVVAARPGVLGVGTERGLLVISI